jgi:predicted ribosomally synthesized peptide with SipW-like signal peptide
MRIKLRHLLMSRFANIKRKRLVLCGVIFVFALVGSAAFAYWTSSGEGSGTVKASAGGAAFEVSSTLVEGLYPGGSSAVLVKVKDVDASQSEYLTKVEAEVEKTSVAECKKEWFEVTPASQEPKVLIAHGETKEYTVNLKMKEEAAVNQNACKGASVTLKYKAS